MAAVDPVALANAYALGLRRLSGGVHPTDRQLAMISEETLEQAKLLPQATKRQSGSASNVFEAILLVKQRGYPIEKQSEIIKRMAVYHSVINGIPMRLKTSPPNAAVIDAVRTHIKPPTLQQIAAGLEEFIKCSP